MIGALVVVLVTAGVAVSLFLNSDTLPVECDGIDVPAGTDVQQVIGQHDEGTTFCFAEGTYQVPTPIRLLEDTRLIGAGIDKTYLKGTGAEIVVDAQDAPHVLIAHLNITAAQGNAECRPSCGRGFRGGPDNRVSFVRLHDNANNGIGGSARGLIVENSILDHNGSEKFIACCSGGIKGGTGFTIRDSEVFANNGNGIWCDVGCDGGMEATGNRIFDNTRSGIRYEISGGGALIAGNRIDNNDVFRQEGAHGGIAIVASQNVVIADNIMGDNNGHAIVVRTTPRGASDNVRIEGNKLQGQTIDGCGGDVICAGND
jgi:hypothetical protein